MIFNEFALLASDTARTKAYLQAMISEDKKPEYCIVFSDDIKKMRREMETYHPIQEKCSYFDRNIPIMVSLKDAKIPYKIVESKDINSKQMYLELKELKQKYLIYSGYGGSILKPHLFQIGKEFIHVHAGILPQYRGSTTAYYSYLQEGKFGATAIFLNEGIDEGRIILQDNFGVPKEKIDIDYIYEPYIRSQMLMRVFDIYKTRGEFICQNQKQEDAKTYFIIHPVLKHLAILKLEGQIQEKG